MKVKDIKEQVLSVKLVASLSRYLSSRGIKIPAWLIMLLVESFAVSLHSLVWIFVTPPVSSKFIAFLWAYWGAIIAGIIVVLIEKNIELFLQLTNELAPLLNHKQDEFKVWKDNSFKLNKQILFSLAFAICIFPTTYLFFEQIMGTVAIKFGAPILFTNLLLIGNGFYWLLFLPGATHALMKNMSKINLFDPKNTYWIKQLSNVYSRAALSTSIIGVMVIFPIILGPQTANTNIITSAWLLLVWALALIPYLIAQTGINIFINKERLETATEIQLQIFDILKNPPSDDSEKRLSNLILIYDKAIESKSSIFDINSQILNSLILPLISFILINFEEILKFIQNITK